MANPVSVGGIKRIINKVNGEVIEAANKAAKRKGEKFRTSGTVKVSGNFGFDKDGEFGFVGNVIASTDGPGVGGDLGVDVEDGWSSAGDGTLELEFFVSVTRDSYDDVAE